MNQYDFVAIFLCGIMVLLVVREQMIARQDEKDEEARQHVLRREQEKERVRLANVIQITDRKRGIQ